MAGIKTTISSQILVLTSKLIDALNGFLESILQKDCDILVLPVGDKDHKWSSKIHGPAFQALDLKDGHSGWVSPNTLAGGFVYEEEPRKAEWEQTAPKTGDPASWWISKVKSPEKGFNWGLSASGLSGAVDLETGKLSGVVLIHVTERKRVFKTRVVAANSEAAAKLNQTSFTAKKPDSKAPAFDIATIWQGDARWADSTDILPLQEFFDAKEFEKLVKLLKK